MKLHVINSQRLEESRGSTSYGSYVTYEEPVMSNKVSVTFVASEDNSNYNTIHGDIVVNCSEDLEGEELRQIAIKHIKEKLS